MTLHLVRRSVASVHLPAEPPELALWRVIVAEWDRLAREAKGREKWIRQARRIAARARSKPGWYKGLEAELVEDTEAETVEALAALARLDAELRKRKATSSPPRKIVKRLRNSGLLSATDAVAEYIRNPTQSKKDRAEGALDALWGRTAGAGELDRQIEVSKKLRTKGDHSGNFVAANVVAYFARLDALAPKALQKRGGRKPNI